MANSFPAQSKVHPSFSEPDFVMQYTQASGFARVLEGGAFRVKLPAGAQYVYINGVSYRTEVTGGQSGSNFLPSASLLGTYGSTATYLLRTRAIYDHEDMEAAANYAVALPQAQDYALEEAIYQQARVMCIYGFNPANGEGLLNTPNATAVNLPPDSAGNTTFSTYDNGQLAQFFLQQIANVKIPMFQTGFGITDRVVILGPQRILEYMAAVNIVDVVSYQRPGAGTATQGQVIANVVTEQGDKLEWAMDDTLIGKGQGGADMVIITIPELENPRGTPYNTNKMGELNPSMKAINLMYSDLPAPMKIPTPVQDGAISIVQQMRLPSG
jgi:hypothetical protein